MGIESIPDVIICDVMLPKMNGFEIVRHLKQDDRTCHIPVILLTARADEESRISGLQTLADDYLTKPFSEAELKQRIENLLAVRELLRERFGRQLDKQDEAESELDALGDRDRRFIERAERALAERSADADFSLGEFANLLAMSERQLQRKLKALTGRTPREYLRNFRLDRARSLLKSGERVGEIAFQVGFTSQAYFASCFKARFGRTPSQVRESSSSRAG